MRYTNTLVVIAIIAVGLFIINYFSMREGLTPAPVLTPGVAKDPGQVAAENLTRIANAITSAFAPPSSPAGATTALPDYQELATDPTKKTVFSQDKCAPPQNLLDELPIDAQMKELIDKHQKTMTDSLDRYLAKLTAIDDALNQPKNLLYLNPNIKTEAPSGLPLSKITYDASLNNILNLTLVQGPDGLQGSIGSDGLPGNSIEGGAGGKGSVGVNPFKNASFNELPKWYKYGG